VGKGDNGCAYWKYAPSLHHLGGLFEHQMNRKTMFCFLFPLNIPYFSGGF